MLSSQLKALVTPRIHTTASGTPSRTGKKVNRMPAIAGMTAHTINRMSFVRFSNRRRSSTRPMRKMAAPPIRRPSIAGVTAGRWIKSRVAVKAT